MGEKETKLMELWLNKIHCEKVGQNILKMMPSNSIDCIVTDPPYGINFMGKTWDKALPPKEIFQEMFRVLKAGGLAFVMSSPRQDVLWRMLRMLEECGFVLKQSFISWIYKTGFPKAYDLSLGIDKKLIREEFVKKHGRKPTKEEMKTLLKEKRKSIGQRTRVIAHEKTYHGYENKFENVQFNLGNKTSLTDSYHPLANKWSGWKSITGLKPALECVLMVNKPFSEKTIVDNVLKHGTGAINVDACRIPFDSKESAEDLARSSQGFTAKSETYHNSPEYEVSCKSGNVKGRFPANLLVSDKTLDTGKITKSKPHLHDHKKDTLVYGGGKGLGIRKEMNLYNDVGDQSRFFDLDAWAKHHGFLDVPKASKSERDKGLDNFEEKEMAHSTAMKCAKCGLPILSGTGKSCKCAIKQEVRLKRKNIHPTVKPIKLMAYLIELGCHPDGVVLDPFVGSGTTCIAAKQLRRKWIGIDCYPEYCEIASARLEHCEIVRHDLASKEYVKPQDLYSQCLKDNSINVNQQSEVKQETKQGVRQVENIMCPICGVRMYEGMKAYYCTKANCKGMREK